MLETKHSVVYFGNNLDVLPTLEDNSVDSIVTDPPYELAFMGKSWDSSGIAYNVELWKECLRVLKPGGHLLSFGGTRTWHRVAVAIEDSGFEIRDSIAWMYGSGFPKSLDVSKAIDKRGGQGATLTKQIGNALQQARESREISKSQADQMFCDGSTNWTWFEGRPAGQRPPTPETFALIVAEWAELEPLAALVAEAEREVVGKKAWSNSSHHFVPGQDHTERVKLDISAPSTPEAQQWEGWGTALKPAFEPIVVARKPLIGTVAANVLEHGTGGLNIDGSRIGTDGATKRNGLGNRPEGNQAGFRVGHDIEQISKGRWPANVILDEYSAEILDGQSGQAGGGYGDSGGASRFFYCAKASKTDRNEGLEDLEGRQVFGDDGDTYQGLSDSKNPSKNFHPTVKPTALMTYLVNLVTPPNGTVLDPFTGSGSTGKAAIIAGFNFVGIELTEDYHPIIEGRLKHAEAKLTEAKEKEGEALF